MEWHERLLTFAPLHADHTAENQGRLIRTCLQTFDILDRVITITTDNASSNIKMCNSFTGGARLTERYLKNPIVYVLCLAYVIQLAQGALLENLQCKATNEEIDRNWDDDQAMKELVEKRRQLGLDCLEEPEADENDLLALTLQKVCSIEMW